MSSDAKLKELGSGRIMPLLLKLSWPALVSMTLNALYVVVDRFYIGQGCGQDSMAGLTLAMPLMIGISAFGPLIGVGHGALISIKLGQKDHTTAEKLLGEMVALKIVFFLLITPLVFLNIDPILAISGGAKVSAAALSDAVLYMKITVFSHIFSHLAFGLSNTMRAEGAARQSMFCIIAGFLVNMVLDPLFIFVFGWGVAGAAWATVISMFASCISALWYYLAGKPSVKMRLCRMRIYPDLCLRALSIGLGPFLQQICSSFVNISLNLAFGKWAPSRDAATMQIASAGIFQITLLMFFLPLMGVQQGVGPIIGFNWGARNYARVREAALKGLVFSTAVVTFACAVFIFCPEILARCFANPKSGAALIVQSSKDLRIANCMLWCIGLNVLATTYFQSIGKPAVSITLSLMRQVLCLMPCIWILPYFFEDASLGVWLSMPVSDVLACLATAVPFYLHMRFLDRANVIRENRASGNRPQKSRQQV